MGNNAVAAMGMASVIHQTAIQVVDARMPLASSDKPFEEKNNLIRINNKGPRIIPMRFVIVIDS